MGKILSSLFIVVISFQIFPQQNTLTKERASNFIEVMLNKSDSLESFVLPEELAISKRLGISYEGIKNKFLISYEIPEQISIQIKDGKVKYNFSIEKIDGELSVLNFEVPDANYKTSYYFKNEFLISPPYFYYRNWQKIESKHFIFYVSNPNYFSQYSIDRLESFVENIFSILELTEEEKETIQKEKLIYILCKDEDEIEKLTGYKSRGMGNLAYDYVITTYNCHYHELLHILMNFKLKKLPLYTHPFFQEGFAVAFGGRGGYEPGIVLNLGKFLVQSDFLKADQLFNINEYKSYDVSMSYPLCGLYSLFLITKTGMGNYLRLYLKYSANNINSSVIDSTDFPAASEWNEFVNNFSNETQIKIDFPEEGFQTLSEDSSCVLKVNDEYYFLKTRGNLLIPGNEITGNYNSKIFKEFCPDKNYNNEKYLIRVNDGEVAVYNLYTNNLIANYVSGFSLEFKSVPKENDYFRFLMNRNIFDENFDKFEKIKTEN